MQTVDPKAQEMADRINLVVGTIMMVLGSGLSILVFADRTGVSLDWMPPMWFSTREFHILICILIFAFAALVLKLPARGPEEAASVTPPFHSVKFYTREQCELCDSALETLRRYENVIGEFTVIDIDHDPDLQSKFGNCVPVLEVDGKVRFRGSIEPELLLRLVEGANRQRQSEEQGAQSEPHRDAAGADSA